ncbi:MAG: hypothetical protein GKR90_01425 [Pseudomonadales bacterium]|nr:hypothetical protein [Pseudomonadales bacterium]
MEGDSSYLGGFKARVDQFGLKRAVFWYLTTLIERTFKVHVHYVFVTQSIPDRQDFFPPEGYEHRAVAPIDLLPYVPVCDELSEEMLRESEANKDTCLASFYQNELVGFDFSSTSRAPVTDQLDFVVPSGFRYGYKGWTHPDHRRKKLSQGRIELHKTLRTAAMFYIKINNYPSLLRPYRYPGARRMHTGYVGWIEFRERQIPFASRRAKWVGCEFAPKGETLKRRYTET